MAQVIKWADGGPVIADSTMRWADGGVASYYYAAAGGSNYDVSFSLAAQLAAAAGGQAAAAGAAAFSTSLGVSDGGGAQASGGCLLPAQVVTIYQAAAGIFAQLALALGTAMSANAGAVAESIAAVQLPVIVDYGDYGQITTEASVDMGAAALQLASLGSLVINVALGISHVLAAEVQAQAASLGGVSINVVPAILAAATALAQAGFVAEHIMAVSTDGTRITVTVNTPAWRTVTVAAENRVVTVAAENRSIIVQ